MLRQETQMLILFAIQFSTLVCLQVSRIDCKKQLKKLAENQSKNSKPKSVNFEQDIKYLEKILQNNLEYFVNILLRPLAGKQSDSMLKDTDIEEAVTTITVSILSELSDDYKEVLSFYIKDIESYIAKRVTEKLTPYIVGLNVNKLS